MTAAGLLAALGVGMGAAAVASLVVPARARLAARVRPYALGARIRLGHADAAEPAPPPAVRGGVVVAVFGPPVAAALGRVSRLVESRDDDRLALRLYQAGLPEVTPDEHRYRQVAWGALGGVAFGLAGGLVVGTPVVVAGLVVSGCVFGATRVRSRVDRLVAERAERMRRELYTINQLLAIHLRTGVGPMQAVRRVVARTHGAVAEELEQVLRWARGGLSEAESFRRAASTTPEPGAARTYELFAVGAERGADLAGALLALGDDLRDARREELRRGAVRRRAAMLLPTIAILAPIMLLFIAAPLPSVVLGRG